MKINYKKYGDYYLPDLALAEKENKKSIKKNVGEKQWVALQVKLY